MSYDLIIGECDNEQLSISPEDQLKHTIIFDHTSSESRKLTLSILEQKIACGEGLIFIQGDENELENQFKDLLSSANKLDLLVPINNDSESLNLPDLKNLIITIVTQSKIAYVNFAGISKLTNTRLFIQAFSESIEELRHMGGSRRYKQCNVVTTNLECIQSRHWMKLMNFARVCNIALINSVGSFERFVDLDGTLGQMYQTIYSIFEGSHNRILFSQVDYRTNIEFSRFAEVRNYELTKNGVIRSKKSFKNDNVIFHKLTRQQFVLLNGDLLNIVNI